MRVQIPVYTDRWWMGDRYGEVVKFTNSRKRDDHGELPVIAHVKLDKSGKVVRVMFDDCTVV